MASPAVAATTEGALGSAGANVAVTLPGSGSATDGYLVIIAKGATSVTINALTDWAEALDESTATGLAVLWYTGSGVPSNPTFVQSGNSRSAWAAYRITGTRRGTTPTVGTTATGSSTTPDPPSATVSGGPLDVLAIACFSRGGEIADDDSLVSAFPTNYTSGQVEKSAGTAGTNLAGIIGSAARQISGASSADPGTFTASTGAWRAQTIIVYPPAEVTRSAAIDGAGAIASVATFFSIFTRASALDGAGAIATVGQIIDGHNRSVALDATGAVSASGQVIKDRSAAVGATGALTAAAFNRDLLRSAAHGATASLAVAAFQRDLLRQVAHGATGAISSDGFAELARAATLSATAGVASVPQRDLLRQLALGSTADINATGNIEGGFITHTRSAALDATGALAGVGLHIAPRSAAVGATAGIASVGIEVLARAALLDAAAGISTAPQRELIRTAAVAAIADIAGVGAEAVDWSYDASVNWTYGPFTGHAYSGGTLVTYDGGNTWTYTGV